LFYKPSHGVAYWVPSILEGDVNVSARI
jgi:hypothetical protein